MSPKTILHQTTLEKWAARFTDQKASGLTVDDWCAQNGVSRDSYFYWKRKLKNELITQVIPEIVPLALPETPVSELNVLPSAPCRGNLPSGATCTTYASNTTNSSAKIHIGDVTIELATSAPESFIVSIIKAVRYA